MQFITEEKYNNNDNDNDTVDDQDRIDDDDQSSSSTSFHTAAEEEEAEEEDEEEYQQGMESIRKAGDNKKNDTDDDDDDDIETGRCRNSTGDHSVALTSSVMVLNPNPSNPLTLTRSSTSYGIQPKPLPLMLSRSTSVVGAFAISNPLSGNSSETISRRTQSLSSSGSGPGDDVDTSSTNIPLTSSSLTRAATTSTATATTVTATTRSLLLSNVTDGDTLYGSQQQQHCVTEAVLVDVDRVVLACIIDNNDNNNSNNNNDHDNNTTSEKANDEIIDHNDNDTSKKKERTCYIIAIGGILIAVVVVIILLIVFLGGDTNNNDNNNSNVTTTITATTITTPVNDEKKQKGVKKTNRYHQILRIIGPISETTNHSKTLVNKKAVNWISAYDVLSHALLTTMTNNYNETKDYVTWKIQQRYVLAVFYFATNGPDWLQQHQFLTPDLDECEWKQQQDQEQAKEQKKRGVSCNQQGKVEHLRMWWNNMSGTLPQELPHFRESLRELTLTNGYLTGIIPASFAKLTRLETLALNDHCLSGTIPTQFALFPNLGRLTLGRGNYDLTGSLQGFCNGTQYLHAGKHVVVSANCDTSTFCPTTPTSTDDDEFPTNTTTNYNKYTPAKVDCECCSCCNPDTFQCCTPDGSGGSRWEDVYHRRCE